uniref:Uncharacterized protein n=1 Tax=uncultured bacterium contig00093 TaxID=1181564 RepID=A0A806KJP8_9BACT|nr:hypothetical protein [uncultured bacterium contig00093]
MVSIITRAPVLFILLLSPESINSDRAILDARHDVSAADGNIRAGDE